MIIRYVLLAFCAALAVQCVVADDDTKVAERERKFAEAYSGVVLVGSFSIDGIKKDMPHTAGRYELKSVKKAKDGNWTFTARVTYLKMDLTLPVTVPVVWAGETPMISLTNATLPGLGKELSAKVIFDGERYAGTWKHGKYGGHMWGKIERMNATTSKPADDQARPPERP